jgi:hypothetical protein
MESNGTPALAIGGSNPGGDIPALELRSALVKQR